MSDTDYLTLNKIKRTKPVVYTRTMGYYRPVESFNVGKQGEHQQRKYFKHDGD